MANHNHVLVSSWKQPVLNNEGKMSRSRKQRAPSMFELTSARHSSSSSQTRKPLCYIAP